MALYLVGRSARTLFLTARFVSARGLFSHPIDCLCLCSVREASFNREASSERRTLRTRDNGSYGSRRRLLGAHVLHNSRMSRDVWPTRGQAMGFSTSAIALKEAIPLKDLVIPSGAAVVPEPLSSESFVIPEPPPVPASELLPDGGQLLLQTPTSDLTALGLGGWWPPGIFQQGLDLLHSTGLPWWACIVSATMVIRLALFPLVIKAQRNAAVMQKNMPEMQRLQLQMSEARANGDNIGVAMAANELSLFMKKEGFNPIKSMIPMFAQAPVFLSVFMGLRRMANAPVESMKEGGMLWFTDLTKADPYYLLPVLTCSTLFLVIEKGAESGGQDMTQPNMVIARYLFRAIPVITLPFISNFPAALLCYWFTSNAVSLAQVFILKIPRVREVLKIPPIVKHDPSKLRKEKKTLKQSWRESMHNSRIAKEVEDRVRIDSVRFRQAGMGPIQKTYKYDPTKTQSQSAKFKA